MRKTIVFIIMLLITVAGAQAVAEIKADASGIMTIFEGVITDQDGEPIKGAKVKIFCEHDYPKQKGGYQTKVLPFGTVKTDAFGRFQKSWPNLSPGKQCVIGDRVWVDVTFDDTTHTSDSVEVQESEFMSSPAGRASLSVGVPEFSTATLALAIVGVTLGVVALRRKE